MDISIRAYHFTETHYLPNETVTQAFKDMLHNLTGLVNNAPYKGRAVGEVVFDGAAGARRGQGDWEITRRFAASPNAIGLEVGQGEDKITGIMKKGWEYVDVKSQLAVRGEGAFKILVPVPIAVYVHQVFFYGNFDAMEAYFAEP